MNELLKKLRKYDIRIRKAINTQMHGDFHSVFKGYGLEFSDVRSYQYGDDVRTIDWNVTAKGHGTFVKTFKEEKEQYVLFLLDVSASQDIGIEGQKKIEVAKEICGVLTLSASRESGNVGLICYSDQQELLIQPEKGDKHAYNTILKLFALKPKSTRTKLNKAILTALSILKRKSIVFLISDFIDNDYEQNLIALSKKHYLVVIHISESRETGLPRLGIIPIYDTENKKTIWVNSSSKEFRNKLIENFENNKKRLQDLCIKHDANYLWIDTKEDYINKLVKLFRIRKRHK